MVNSINTNIAAYYAQQNIGNASDNASTSIARLSSGSRIVHSSDDVAALAAGTTLKTQVTALRQALVNTTQGTSLLQVADGALTQVSSILQRQKAIAVQATSGSLSDTERGFLDQEFQSLTAEIDRLVNNTGFNAVKLLNGAVSGQASITTNTRDNLLAAALVAQPTAGMVTTIGAGNAANGDQITINGLTVNFTSSAPGTAAAVGKVSIGASVTDTATNLVNFLNNNTDPRLANLTFTNAAGVVSANWAGGVIDTSGTYVVGATVVTGANITVGSAANRTIAIVAAVQDGLGLDRTKAIGTVTGSVLANGGTLATTAGQAIDTRLINNNKDFIGALGTGKMGKITATYANATDTVAFSLKVGDITYATTAADIATGAVQTLTFTGVDGTNTARGGSFTLTLNGLTGFANGSITGQAGADDAAAQINSALSGVQFYQNRDVKSFQEGQVVYSGGADVGVLNGMTANLRTSNFSGNIGIENLTITAPTGGSTDATFTAVINGETYKSISGIGNQIGLNTVVALQSTTNPANVLSIVTGNTSLANVATTALDLSTQAKADAVAAGIRTAFGLDNSVAKLSFQVGSASTDTVGVKIQSVSSATLFNGLSLSVTTAVNAAAASDQLDLAINTVTSVRANVGALQSRFNFAGANVETAIQNEDAARGSLLDTDVAAESTAYATAQVQIQAGIAVLAQANQLPQSLLKLIG